MQVVAKSYIAQTEYLRRERSITSTAQNHASTQIRFYLVLLLLWSGWHECRRRSLYQLSLPSVLTLQGRPNPGSTASAFNKWSSSFTSRLVLDRQALTPDIPYYFAWMISEASPAPLASASLHVASLRSVPTGPFSWPLEFSERGSIPVSWENSPWIAQFEEDAQELGQSDASLLLVTEPRWPADRHRVKSLQDILHDATVQKLQDEHFTIPDRKLALIIDGNRVEGDVRIRKFLGGLCARKLLVELKKDRYLDSHAIDHDPTFISAERRLLYMVDVDAWGMLALIGSAPESLFRVLGDFLINYICPKSSLGVSFSTTGHSTFMMQFSFPFMIWRSTTSLMKDSRTKRSDGESLRSSRDVTFLKSLANPDVIPDDTEGIYDSHISCIVTGFDHDRWHGMVLTETWFEQDKHDDPSPDKISRYENDYQDTGLLVDPLCRGKVEVKHTQWLPRLYFARALEIRLGQIYRESENIVSNLDDILDKCDKRHKHFRIRMTRSERHSPTTTTSEWDLSEFRDFQNGLNSFQDILEEIYQCLHQIVRSGDRFMNTDVNYFLNDDETADDAKTCRSSLSQIRNTFNALRERLDHLNDMKQRLQAMLKTGMSTQKMINITENSPQRRQLEPRILAWTTIMSQPLVITAAIFGCDDIITFKRTWTKFMVVLVAVTFVMYARA
ncbi:hypothetical protein K456DRAFT_1739449 [Colletotrichum gloeosporioides 23]|nr:hypothetical protein K456DRAFT_1739449 [Colletotrichum gloeosporioides 23]